ncbi:amidase [Arvimicrobium flavum]|uniref:amidase n=1 Tax=Arvimicrobium flavum TaxID=3393320 RepID=UPI00237B3354|nr:amidase [Mesorhizobium shangrilense]
MTERPRTKHDIPEASELCRLSARELAARIARRTLSVREVVTAFLNRIEAVNSKVNAIVSLRERGDILREADEKDAYLAAGGKAGPLFGLPIAIKDLAETKGLRTTWGSPIFKDFVPDRDAIHVERIRAAGAVIIGKTNVPEFGLGSQTYNNVFGPTLNAFDPELSAGGSSGGAAVALALDMLPIADGSDYGGSLRNPAAFNNVYGLRPSQGRVPGSPDKDLFFAQIGVDGPMGRDVRDLAMLLDVQAGYDPRSPLSLATDGSFLAGLDRPASPARIGWLGDLGGHLPMEAGVRELCETAVRRFEEADWKIEAMVPAFDFEALWAAFATLRHAASGCGLKPLYDDPHRRALLKPEGLFEVEGSLNLTAPDIHAATIVRSDWYRAVLALFDRFDLLALPSAAVFPFAVTTHWPSEIAGRRMSSYHRWLEVASYASMAGCPAVNVPAGFDAAGRPMGLQLIGRPRGDLAVLRAAALYESLLDWPAGASH